VRNIRQWEQDFLGFLEASHPKVLEGIRTRKTLDDALTAELKAAVEAFKPAFRAA
jgi:F0F1-type ATP synthase alpha subunit